MLEALAVAGPYLAPLEAIEGDGGGRSYMSHGSGGHSR
jgi:hypothetical protein